MVAKASSRAGLQIKKISPGLVSFVVSKFEFIKNKMNETKRGCYFLIDSFDSPSSINTRTWYNTRTVQYSIFNIQYAF